MDLLHLFYLLAGIAIYLGGWYADWKTSANAIWLGQYEATGLMKDQYGFPSFSRACLWCAILAGPFVLWFWFPLAGLVWGAIGGIPHIVIAFDNQSKDADSRLKQIAQLRKLRDGNLSDGEAFAALDPYVSSHGRHWFLRFPWIYAEGDFEQDKWILIARLRELAAKPEAQWFPLNK